MFDGLSYLEGPSDGTIAFGWWTIHGSILALRLTMITCLVELARWPLSFELALVMPMILKTPSKVLFCYQGFHPALQRAYKIDVTWQCLKAGWCLLPSSRGVANEGGSKGIWSQRWSFRSRSRCTLQRGVDILDSSAVWSIAIEKWWVACQLRRADMRSTGCRNN